MSIKYEILVVDDHPIIVDSYINLLSENSFAQESNFMKSYDCKDAYNKIISNYKGRVNIDLALLDLNLPSYMDFNINDGVDLGLLLREKFPNCIIIILTMKSEPLAINRIIRKIQPEGFFCKTDIMSESFSSICQNIIDGKVRYQSQTIKDSQRDLFKKNINWDNHDNEILLLISQGVKTINLPSFIPLSMSAIEKRKANIKDQLLKGKGSDKDLVNQAKKIGLL